MADAKKSEAAGKAASSSPASESGDPAVHKLLADLQTAHLNEDKEAVADAKKALGDLGVTAE